MALRSPCLRSLPQSNRTVLKVQGLTQNNWLYAKGRKPFSLKLQDRMLSNVPQELTPQAQDCMLAFSYEISDDPDDPDEYGTDVECFWGFGFADVSG